MSMSNEKLMEIGGLLQELLIEESGEQTVPYILVIMPLAAKGSALMGEGGYVSNIDPSDAAMELRRTAGYLDGTQKKEVEEAIQEAASAKKH